ncbi:hypothetical protein [Allorhizocola rhizosphaerae]|uniref:hypothetical protein n=1 Tax=Allorhizocola rhizosphaerae TaxID=1872709 RepID=UPI000E3D5C77|nr:hypothetical protein [Allorhizocola rhizosphaerae]
MSSADVDQELLADYLGGALDGTPQKDHVERLVATSPQWRAAAEEMSAALDLVALDLAALRDAPEPMPADIAAQFDELLAPPKRDPLAARPVARKAGRKRKWKRWAAPIAVAAAVLAFFGVGRLPEVASTMSGGSAQDNRGTAESAPQADQPMPASAAGIPMVRTGAQYTRGSLGLRNSSTEKAGELSYRSESMPATSPWQRLEQPPALLDCLHVISLALPGRATLVEYAYFDHKPALVISITTTDREWRFVAGMSCGLTGPDELYRAPLP